MRTRKEVRTFPHRNVESAASFFSMRRWSRKNPEIRNHHQKSKLGVYSTVYVRLILDLYLSVSLSVRHRSISRSIFRWTGFLNCDGSRDSSHNLQAAASSRITMIMNRAAQNRHAKLMFPCEFNYNLQIKKAYCIKYDAIRMEVNIMITHRY